MMSVFGEDDCVGGGGELDESGREKEKSMCGRGRGGGG